MTLGRNVLHSTHKPPRIYKIQISQLLLSPVMPLKRLENRGIIKQCFFMDIGVMGSIEWNQPEAWNISLEIYIPEMEWPWKSANTTSRVRISTWAYPKGVSSLTSFHYIWKSLGPFSLPCAQTWPSNINHQSVPIRDRLSHHISHHAQAASNNLTGQLWDCNLA